MQRIPRLLRTTTFRLTLIYFGLFGVSAVVLVGFLYWSTAGFMARQTDEAIEAEIRGLAEQYSQFGTIGLVRALNRRTSEARASRGLYLLTDANLRRIAGNLSAWPREEPQPDGWITFELEYADRRGAVDPSAARGRARERGQEPGPRERQGAERPRHVRYTATGRAHHVRTVASVGSGTVDTMLILG